MSKVKKILIIKLGASGDVLRTTCILPGLTKKYRGAHIDWLTSITAISLIANNPLIHNVLDRDEYLYRNLSDIRYDLVINLDDDSFACNFSSQISATQLVGAFTDGKTKRYTDDSAEWFDMSLISRYGKMKADQLKQSNRRTYPSILFKMLDISSGRPFLGIPERERDLAHTFSQSRLPFPRQRPVIGLNASAGPRWRYKQLSERKTATLINQLSHTLDATVLLFGGSDEQDRNRSILELCNNSAIDSGCRNSILEFSALIELCDILITSDSLALHIASALDIPIVAFFGPTSPNEIELFTAGEKIVPNMDCLCCYKRDCDFRPTCMDNISLERLIGATKQLLKI